MNHPPIVLSTAIKYGWRACWATAWTSGPAWLRLAVLSEGMGLVAEVAAPEGLLGMAAFNAAVILVVMLPIYGYVRLALDHHDGRLMDGHAAFNGNAAFFPSVTYALIYALSTSAGMLLLVPGLWILFMYGMGFWIVADRPSGGLAAVRECRNLVRGNRLRILALGVVTCAPMALTHWLITLPGFVGFVPAILLDAVVFSVSTHGCTHAYRQLVPDATAQTIARAA